MVGSAANGEERGSRSQEQHACNSHLVRCAREREVPPASRKRPGGWPRPTRRFGVANPTSQLNFVQPDARPRRRVVLTGRTSSTRVVFGLLLAVAAAVVIGTKYEAAQKTQLVLS